MNNFLFSSRHVHEKAILLVIVPLTVLSFFEPRDAAILPLCSLTGHVSLLPLLFRPQVRKVSYSRRMNSGWMEAHVGGGDFFGGWGIFSLMHGVVAVHF